MNNELKKICNKTYGSVVVIGLDNEKVKDVIEENNDVLSLIYLTKDKRKKFKGEGITDKKIVLRKIKRIFKSKSINFMICNYDVLKDYQRHFIKNSINITSEDIFYYGKIENIDLEELEYRYKRYGCDIEIIKEKTYFIMRVSVNKIKAPFRKNIFYRIKDVFHDLVDAIGDLMAS